MREWKGLTLHACTCRLCPAPIGPTSLWIFGYMNWPSSRQSLTFLGFLKSLTWRQKDDMIWSTVVPNITNKAWTNRWSWWNKFISIWFYVQFVPLHSRSVMPVQRVTVTWGLFKAPSGTARHPSMYTQITPLANWSDEEIWEWFGVNLSVEKRVDDIIEAMDYSSLVCLGKNMQRRKRKVKDLKKLTEELKKLTKE